MWKRNLGKEILCVVELCKTEMNLSFLRIRIWFVSVKKAKFSWTIGLFLITNCKRVVFCLFCLLSNPSGKKKFCLTKKFIMLWIVFIKSFII